MAPSIEEFEKDNGGNLLPNGTELVQITPLAMSFEGESYKIKERGIGNKVRLTELFQGREPVTETDVNSGEDLWRTYILPADTQITKD